MSENGVKKGKVNVDGIEIYHEIRGKGDHVVLLLPGALGMFQSDYYPEFQTDMIVCIPQNKTGTCSTDFVKQYEGFDLNQFTLICWDAPGYGQSRPPHRIQYLSDTKNYYRKDADLALKMMESLGYSSYSVVGFSDGGRTGLIMAAKNPSVIRKAVAWGCNSYITNPEKDVIRSIRNVSLWAENIRKPLADIYGHELQAIWSKLTDCWTGYDNIFREDLPKIQCPVFILHGDKDPMVAKHQPEFFKANISRCRTHHFPYGGHNVQQTNPSEFNQMVQEFLEA